MSWDRETLNRKCDETLSLGGTQILYQGGLNPDLDMAWHEQQVAFMKSKGLHVHGYSPPEIVFMAQEEGIPIHGVIERLKTRAWAQYREGAPRSLWIGCDGRYPPTGIHIPVA